MKLCSGEMSVRMRRLAGITVVLLGLGAVASVGVRVALAATPAVYYVNNAASTGCSDTGPGTSFNPFCTIAAGLAAVQPGQRVSITGTYKEHVTVAKSGTPTAPIIVSGGVLRGPDAGLTIDGQHDVDIESMILLEVSAGPSVLLSNSTRINSYSLNVETSAAAAPAMELINLTDSKLYSDNAASAAAEPAISIDPASTGLTLRSSSANAHAGTAGIDISGSHNIIENSTVTGGSVAGIALHPGASGNIVVNNTVDTGAGIGILNDGASGTAIANNDASGNCSTGIKVAGASSGVSVQNNIANANGVANRNCATPTADAVNIGVYDGAAGQTTVNYNDVYQGGAPNNYAWQAPMTLDQFRAASGQAAHDAATGSATSASAMDSANSAAPGYPSTDQQSRARVDDPNLPDTGAGPVTYADRGPTELGPGPLPAVQMRAGPDTMTLNASVLGPQATDSYAFDFGDGTPVVTGQASTVAHTYARPGRYVVQVTETNPAYQLSGTTSTVARPVQCTSVASLLARADNRYVSVRSDERLYADTVAPGAAQALDLCDAGGGLVALRSPARNAFVSVNTGGDKLLGPSALAVDDNGVFQVTTYTDGTASLKLATTGLYVSAENAGGAALVANRQVVGAWEKFNVVDTAHQSRSLHAHADNRFVTAENAGKSPLVANRTAVGAWESFDIIDAGSGHVALYSHADGEFVTAENAGKSPLIANRTAIGGWELFQLITNPDGSISLKALADGRYVTAESAGKSALIANRTAIGGWEEFDLR
jgi:parallel beta-helix repeat protein